MHVHDHLTLEELQRLTQSIQGTRHWKRYQAVVLAIQGRPAVDIARCLDCSDLSGQSKTG